MPGKRSVWGYVLAAAALVAMAGSAAAQDDKGPLSRLTVHGFLTQAYAVSNFAEGGPFSPTPDEIILGIPEDGTWDYRNLALQFRYEITPKDIVIVQFSSRSLGDSPIGDVEDEIELDWAFYERRLTDQASIKIGRVQIPLGIYNEIRDVGTVLPFYRPSFAFYREGAFTSETIDGVVLAHTFGAESDWALDADVYFGEFTLQEFDAFGGEGVLIARAEDVYGLQLWLSTPVSGLRFGLGGHKRDVTEGGPAVVRPPGVTDQFDDYYLSIDLTRDRFLFQTEVRRFSADPNQFFFGGTFDLYYAQAGFNITDKFRVYALAEYTDISADREDTLPNIGIPFTEDLDFTNLEAYGVALNYQFTPNLVLKAEHHFGIDVEFFTLAPVFTPTGPALQPSYIQWSNGDYSILSFSTSF